MFHGLLELNKSTEIGSIKQIPSKANIAVPIKRENDSKLINGTIWIPEWLI